MIHKTEQSKGRPFTEDEPGKVPGSEHPGDVFAASEDGKRSSNLLTDEVTPSSPWPTLGRLERWVVLLTGLIVLGIGVRHLPHGIYFCDQGDLQIACATLGIAHSPGYVGYAAVGWVLTKVFFFVEPAYLISLACLGCVVVSLMLSTMILIRVGVPAVLCGAISLLLVNHKSVWYNMNVPEVYAPSLVLLVGITYLLCKYGRLYRRRDLLLAGALYGFLVINRPPALFLVPGLLLGLGAIERRRGLGWSAGARRALGTICTGAVTSLAVLVLIWMRDSPGNPYNHVQAYAEVYGKIPVDNSTLPARWERFKWLVTGQEFSHYMGSDLGQSRSKFRWVRRQLFVYDRLPFYVMLGLMGLGGYVLLCRQPEAAWVAAFAIAGQTGYLVQYRVHDQAADLLPIIFGGSLLLGACVPRLLPTFFGPGRRILPIAAYMAIGGWTAIHAEIRYNWSQLRYAVPYLEEFDFESLPENSVIISGWSPARPLWYKRVVEGVRQDIQIISANYIEEWPGIARQHPAKPVFYTSEAPTPEGYTLKPWRNVWRLEPLTQGKTANVGS